MASLFAKGHYKWNDQVNNLEFISEDPLYDNSDRKRNKGHFSVGLPQVSYKPTKSVHGYVPSIAGNTGVGSSRLVGRHGLNRGSPRLGGLRFSENSAVELHDVKTVVMDMLLNEKEMERSKVSASFQELVLTHQFNSFLVTLLRYFNCFFEGLEQEKKPQKSSYLEPSKAEVRAIAETKQKLAASKRKLGQSYCVLLLGLGLEKHHHMGCGRQRVSSTHRDKKVFEDLYTYCTLLIWVTFRRRESDRIGLEIGDMLRSETFNPALRHKHHTPAKGTIEKMKKPAQRQQEKDGKKPVAERVQELLSAKLPQIEKITPAQRRRQNGRRPAIMQAIHQRSSALVSLLPSPKEESAYLFKSRAQNSPQAKGDVAEMFDPVRFQEVLSPGEKIGIIGEPMDLFNPENLLPRNMENDDDTDSRNENSSSPSVSKNAHPRQILSKHSAMSRATTEDGDNA